MINGFKVLGLIPARGGSKRIPKKNIKEMFGKPLISWTIDEAKKSKYIDRLITSTDSEEIASIAKKCGSEVPFMRPAELAEDTVRDFPVFDHALTWLKEHEQYVPDIVVLLRPTSPLRTVADIDGALELLAAHPEADSVRTVTAPEQSPYKMFKVRDDGFLEPLLTIPGEPEAFEMPTQKLPRTYKRVGYVDCVWSRTVTVKSSVSGERILPLILEGAENGVDTMQMWERCEHLLEKRIKALNS